jgi:transcriptional regulator
MYIPAAFAEQNLEAAFELIGRYSFGVLVSSHDGEPVATHLPMRVERDPASDGSKAALVGHMARANRQWEGAEGQTVMAVFTGPHAYVSPTWYEAADVVPTWNYAAVHVYGTFRAVHDERETMRIVQEMVKTYEAGMPSPWAMDPGGEFNRKMIRAVVGFRVEITRVVTKLKMSQNQPVERRERVAAALRASGNPGAVEVAAMMEEIERKARG